VLIDTQAGLETRVVPALWRTREWMANGPGAVQESVAASILGADVDPSPGTPSGRRCPGRPDRPRQLPGGRDDITGRLGEITAPAIIFHGDADAAIPMARAEVLRDGLSGAGDIVVVIGAGHASNLSHPTK